MKILVDTDIGSDIDDALCLSYLFNRPDAEIVGISTVTGEPHRRACLASAVARFYGRDVPICVGSADPISGEQRQARAPQSAILGDWPHENVFLDAPVERFLADRIQSSPGEVVLLAIGPLTNIARLIRAFPEALAKLARLVCMSGRFSDYEGMANVPEWNVLCDIEAAGLVYEAAGRVETLLVSSDVTRRLVLKTDAARDVLNRLRLGPVLEMSGIWFESREKMTIHDGFAAALLFEPELCSHKRGVPVLDRSNGVTSWRDVPHSRIAATSTVHDTEFFEHFFGVIPDAAKSG